MDIDALAEKYDWQGFETYLYIFGALGTFSLRAMILITKLYSDPNMGARTFDHTEQFQIQIPGNKPG
jgi:hypothetical protein